MALNRVLVTGNLGTASLGAAVTFTPSTWLTDPVDDLFIPPGPAVCYANQNGSFSATLLATDNAAPLPSGWTWAASITGISQVTAYTFSFSLKAGPVTFTATNATPCVFTAAAPTSQPWAAGEAVTLTGTLPTGFGSATTYYVVSPATSTFQLATTPGGTAVNSSSTGSGSALITQVDITDVAPVP
jgi:hypothetical protein